MHYISVIFCFTLLVGVHAIRLQHTKLCSIFCSGSVSGPLFCAQSDRLCYTAVQNVWKEFALNL